MAKEAIQMSSDFRDSDRYRMGEQGEKLVGELAEEFGWFMMRADEAISKKAPMLERKHERTVLPDILASRGGDSRFIEVKTKSKPVPRRKENGTLQHGVDSPNWKAYCDTQRETGLPVWLFVYENDSGTLLRARLNDLEIHHIADNETTIEIHGNPMVYWNRDNFEAITVKRDADSAFGQDKLDTGAGTELGGLFGESKDDEQQSDFLDFSGGDSP